VYINYYINIGNLLPTCSQCDVLVDILDAVSLTSDHWPWHK